MPDYGVKSGVCSDDICRQFNHSSRLCLFKHGSRTTVSGCPRPPLTHRSLLRFLELEQELVGMTAERGIEHTFGVIIGRVGKDLAF